MSEGRKPSEGEKHERILREGEMLLPFQREERRKHGGQTKTHWWWEDESITNFFLSEAQSEVNKLNKRKHFYKKLKVKESKKLEEREGRKIISDSMKVNTVHACLINSSHLLCSGQCKSYFSFYAFSEIFIVYLLSQDPWTFCRVLEKDYEIKAAGNLKLLSSAWEKQPRWSAHPPELDEFLTVIVDTSLFPE